MPIKKVSVTFDLDMDVFMKVLHHGNTGVRVEMFADAKHSPKLLPPPDRVGARKLILDYLVKNKDRDVVPSELAKICTEHQYAKGTHSSTLHMLVMKGFVKHGKDGYRPTAKAVSNGEG